MLVYLIGHGTHRFSDANYKTIVDELRFGDKFWPLMFRLKAKGGPIRQQVKDRGPDAGGWLSDSIVDVNWCVEYRLSPYTLSFLEPKRRPKDDEEIGLMVDKFLSMDEKKWLASISECLVQ